MDKIQSQIQQIVSDKIAPCVLFWVEHEGKLLYQEAQGTTMYADVGSQPIAEDAIFDIASITKIVVATAVLMLIDKGILSLSCAKSCAAAFNGHRIGLVPQQKMDGTVWPGRVWPYGFYRPLHHDCQTSWLKCNLFGQQNISPTSAR